MSSGPDRDDVYRYGHLGWIGGFLFAGFIIWLMFFLADGFS